MSISNGTDADNWKSSSQSSMSNERATAADRQDGGLQESAPREMGATENATPRAPSGEPDEWTRVATQFVDDPRGAVGRAHELVGRVVQSIVENLNTRCSTIEQEWSQASDSNTETMRVCLQRYRALAQRLSSSDIFAATETQDVPREGVSVTRH
jgi:hypothetical protein